MKNTTCFADRGVFPSAMIKRTKFWSALGPEAGLVIPTPNSSDLADERMREWAL